VQTPVWPTLFKPGSRWGLTAIGNFSKLVPKEFKKPQDYKKQGEELLSSAEGVNAAVYWHRVSRTQKERFETLANDSSRTPGDTAPVPEGWTTTFWPIAPAYKINAVTDSGGAGTIDDATRYVQQVRVGFVGFEFVKHPAQSYASVTGGDADTEAAQPFTISVEGVFTQCFTHLDLCKDLFGSGATGRVSAELTTVIPVFRRIPHLERIPLFGPTLKASPVLVQIAVAPNQRALYRVNLLVLK